MATAQQRGFSLIELMIVLTIIGLLAALAIPQYQDYVMRSRWSSAVTSVASIKTAVAECVQRSANSLSACTTIAQLDLRDAAGDLLSSFPTPPGAASPVSISAVAAISIEGSAQLGSCVVTLTPTNTGSALVWAASVSGTDCGRSRTGIE
jgi:type IV pilus assembly protein PilA